MTKVVECTSYDQCNGNKQNLSIPKDYDKDVPDAFENGNATEVRIKYGLKQLRKVTERRLAQGCARVARAHRGISRNRYKMRHNWR